MEGREEREVEVGVGVVLWGRERGTRFANDVNPTLSLRKSFTI